MNKTWGGSLKFDKSCPIDYSIKVSRAVTVILEYLGIYIYWLIF